jgi:hypothetical protein
MGCRQETLTKQFKGMSSFGKADLFRVHQFLHYKDQKIRLFDKLDLWRRLNQPAI